MTPIRRLALITAAVAVLGAGPLVSQADAKHKHKHHKYCDHDAGYRYDDRDYATYRRYDPRLDDRYYDRYDRDDDHWYESGYDPYEGGYDRYDRGYDPYSDGRDFKLKRDWPALLGIFLGGGLGAGVQPY